MALNKKSQLPDIYLPIKLRYLQLLDKANRTTSGNLSEIIGGQNFAITDNTGEVGLLKLLQTVLYPYNIESADYNSMIDSINEANDKIDVHTVDYIKHPPYAITAGVANAYIVTLTTPPISYVDGMGIVIKLHVASTSDSTLNINGLGAKNIKDSIGMKVNIPYTLRYESTNNSFIIQGTSSPVNIFSQTSDPSTYAKNNDIWFDLTNGVIKYRTGSTWTTFNYNYF